MSCSLHQFISFSILARSMHSFSICPATTLDYVRRVHLWTPIALNLQSPSNMASYSAMLLVHLSASLLNYNLAAWHNLIPEGEISMVAAPAPAVPQAPSQ
jgi:hypothetical protein